MKEPNNLPIGIQNFEKLRLGNNIYVDKTEFIYRLITKGATWFLSRPRRFGKSLLVSTIVSIFQGRRDLFEGLWIRDSSYNWPVHPIIHIDMSRAVFETPEQLQSELVRQLNKSALDNGLDGGLQMGRYKQAAPVLDNLIERLAEKKGKVVVLVDEYDKPILEYITDVSKACEIRDRLRDFYTILKAQDKNLRFVFLTGVSRFSKVSVFSGINQLNDITVDRGYASMLGYTQTELESNFADYLDAMVSRKGVALKKLLDQIRVWYNGYRFHPDTEAVYNPFSCLLFLQKQEFRYWWFESGTPAFLIDLIQKSSLPVEELEQKIVSEGTFSSFEIGRLNPLSLLLQTGYLTIVGYDSEQRLYTLDYPNQEVREAFLTCLVETFTNREPGNMANDLSRLKKALVVQNPDTFFEILTHIFASIPYDIQMRFERYYQSLFYLIFRLIGMHVHAEVRTATGRIDATVELDSGIWIFEFKLDGSADVAMAQIREREYVASYLGSGKTVHLIGVNFDSKKRNIGEWKMETLDACVAIRGKKTGLVRAIFIGNGEAGKTSLIQALNGEKVTQGGTDMTPGIEISEWRVGDGGLVAHFWDFGGQVIAHATHQFFLRARCLYVLVIDARSADSDPNRQVEYWLEFVRAYGGDAPVLLVGSKCDLMPVQVDMVRLRESYPNIFPQLFSLSATQYRKKFAGHFQIFRDAFVEQLKRVGETQPYFSEKKFAIIERLRLETRRHPFLKKETFEKLYEEQGLEIAEREEFLELLDRLGEIIYFPKLYELHGFDDFLLNPRWLTYGVYRLLYSDTLKEEKGRLRRNDIEAVLRDRTITDERGNILTYPSDKLDFLVWAMEQFKLCYPVAEGSQGEWIVPDLLPSDQPERLDFDRRDALRFEFLFATFLPRHLLGSFIVDHYRDIRDSLVWQHGARLESRKWPYTQALARIDNRSRTLSLMVSGSHVKRYFSVLYDSILTILGRMPKLKYTKRLYLDKRARIGGVEAPPIRVEEEPFADYEDLLAAEADGEKTFRNKYGRYDLKTLLPPLSKERIINPVKRNHLKRLGEKLPKERG